MSTRILVTGATGFVGKAWSQTLINQGHRVIGLTRDPERARATSQLDIHWIRNPRELNASKDSEPLKAIVNLAGARVVGWPWTGARKQVLWHSRIDTIRTLEAWLQAHPQPGLTWIQASAIGYYGVRAPGERLTEQSTAGQGFMSTLCQDVEQAAQKAADTAHARCVILRLGLVLGRGGALPALMAPHRVALGATLGSGDQVMSWIHLDDVLRVFERAVQDTAMQGIYNAVAPHPLSQREFAQVAAQTLGRPQWLRLPIAPVRLLLGEMAQLLVDGQQVVPERLQQAGFEFRFSRMQEALKDLK
jgi:uncharacterized protein